MTAITRITPDRGRTDEPPTTLSRVAEEPRLNAAADFMRMALDRISSFDEWPERPTRVAREFVLDDRRSIIGLGRAGRDVAMAYSAAAWKVGGGAPTLRLGKVIGTRGDRLVAAIVNGDTEDGWEDPSIMVWQLDAELRDLELAVMFDADDSDAAMTELGRLHAELDD